MGIPPTNLPSPGPDSSYRYWAFISYSHRDEVWARWLHTALETYRVPRKLVGSPARIGSETIPERIFPVFKDRDELAGGFDLSERIRLALEQSRYLVVICSPHSVASGHVRSEIETFEAFGREDRVICLIVGGEPNASDKPGGGPQECFPEPVRTRRTLDGDLVPVQPLAADVRKGGDGKTNATLKILATILEVELDDLKQREERRRFRRRVRLVTAVVVFALLAGLVYPLALDDGISGPGGEAFRRFLDRHHLSLLRPVRSEAAIRETARALRSRLFARLQQVSRISGWIPQSFDGRGSSPQGVWSHSQAAAALLKSPEANLETVQELASILDRPFGPGVAVEANGTKYGWLSHPGDSSTLAVPALWTSLSLTLALRKGAFPTAEARQQVLQRLSYTQEALALYHPERTQGWNMFPNQEQPSQHNPYATMLALMALLELHRANLPWRGSVEQRDALLESSFQWLVAEFEEKGDPPGWQAGSESLSSISDGLTLQIFGRLLDAEAEAGLRIPPSILDAIPRHLARCAERTIEFPVTGGEFKALITNHKGQHYVARESINFLWHPWAIDCAARWLRRVETGSAPPEQRVAVQRALGHLVIDLGEDEFNEATAAWIFVAAENLCGLSAILPPDSKE